MNVKERIKFFVKSENITISDFEKSLSVANGYVNSISKSIGIDKLELILEKYPNLNLEWLLVGKEPMLRHQEVLIQPQYEKIEGEDDAYKDKYISLLEETIRLQDQLSRKTTENIALKIEIEALKNGDARESNVLGATG